MIVAAGQIRGSRISSVEMLGDTTCSLPNLPYDINASPQMFLNVDRDGNKEVVICGGSPKKTSCYKLVNGTWTSFAELNKERFDGHVAVSLEDKTFIFGGNADGKSSEVLEHGSESWKVGPTVPGKGIEDGCGVAISNQELLLIGGYVFHTLKRIIRYNVTSNSWRNEPSMETDRVYHKCALFKNQIFVTGGWRGLKSVDVLTLEPFTITKGNELNVGRYSHGLGLIHHQGKLTLAAFGGRDSNRNELDSVEVLDEDTKAWKLSTSLKLSRKKYQFGFLSVPYHLICPLSV